MERKETGVMQFGDDWPGIFMRGDNACMIGMYLAIIADMIEAGKEVDAISLTMLRGHAEFLQSCDVRNE